MNITEFPKLQVKQDSTFTFYIDIPGEKKNARRLSLLSFYLMLATSIAKFKMLIQANKLIYNNTTK